MFPFLTDYPQGASWVSGWWEPLARYSTTTTNRLERSWNYTYAIGFRISGLFLKMVCKKPKHVGACNALYNFQFFNSFDSVTICCFSSLYELRHQLVNNKEQF
jgi:hypothetical protein